MQHTINTPEYINNNLISLPHSINTPKYLKKTITETAWTQPIATGATTAIDGGNMIISSSNGTGYLAYDGNSGDNLSYEAAWQPLATTGWLKLELPYNIKISSISIKNSYTQRQNMGISGRFYINSNKTTSLGDSFSLTTSNQISTISVNNIVTNTIYLDITSVSSPSYGGIREITITGTKLTETWSAGTSADYDVIIPQVHSINTPKYLKKVVTETAFVQPILSANGTLGGDKFAVSCDSSNGYDGNTVVSNAYIATDGNNDTYFQMWATSAYTVQSYYIYNPNPLRVKNIKIVNFDTNQYAIWRAIDGNLKGSNDGSNWEVISTFSNNNSATLTINGNLNKTYKYLAIEVTKRAAVENSMLVNFNEIQINATEYVEIWMEGTPNDYDLIK